MVVLKAHRVCCTKMSYQWIRMQLGWQWVSVSVGSGLKKIGLGSIAIAETADFILLVLRYEL